MPIEVASPSALYSNHVNPQWVKLLDVLGMNLRYIRCSGAELFTEDGNCVLDFLSGYCVHNVGHNHPSVIAALKEELDGSGPAMLQSHVPEAAGRGNISGIRSTFERQAFLVGIQRALRSRCLKRKG
jgi:ornithine--oxo-acid transaminase